MSDMAFRAVGRKLASMFVVGELANTLEKTRWHARKEERLIRGLRIYVRNRGFAAALPIRAMSAPASARLGVGLCRNFTSELRARAQGSLEWGIIERAVFAVITKSAIRAGPAHRRS